MFEDWKNAIVTKISIALYVTPGTGKMTHTDRPFHGFILNCGNAVKDYCFADGRVMRTEGWDFFYLPKGSNYYVKTYGVDGCYAINFNTANDIDCEPFVVKFRNTENILKAFKFAEKEWRTQSEFMRVAAIRSVYDIIFLLCSELKKSYVPDAHLKLLAPAIDLMMDKFTENGLSVSYLASVCHISEAYFRRLFEAKFGVSPKEYMIEKRIGYAKQLLDAGEIPVSETAIMCGYSEVSHFSREFTKRVGVSPNEYKKAH